MSSEIGVRSEEIHGIIRSGEGWIDRSELITPNSEPYLTVKGGGLKRLTIISYEVSDLFIL